MTTTKKENHHRIGSSFNYPQLTEIGFLVLSLLATVKAFSEYLSVNNEDIFRRVISHLAIPTVILLTRQWGMKISLFSRDSQLNCSIKQKKQKIIQITKKSSASSLTTLRQASSSNSLSKLSKVMRKLPCFKKGETCFIPTISTTDPFISTELVKKMTLTELAEIVKYAISCRQHEFDEQLFIIGKPPHVHEIINTMNSAIRKSRGVHIHPSTASWCTSGGNFDALYFCAAMRLIVEWRAVKIVPEEYKAYAVGMNMAKRDFIQNIAKVESAIHRWIETEAESGKEDLNSPSIAQLLKFELINQTHPRLPRLKDKTAAIGLLWMTRQLQFQSMIFFNLQKLKTNSATKAVNSAYKTVFGQYHGWAIQKVFNYAFNGTPPVSLLFSMMNPDLASSINSQPAHIDVDPLILAIPSISFDGEKIDDEDVLTLIPDEGFKLHPNIIEVFQNIEIGWKEFASKVEKEWFEILDKVVTGGSYNDDNTNKGIANKLVRAQSDSESTSSVSLSSNSNKADMSLNFTNVQNSNVCKASLEFHIQQETSKAANNDINTFLAVMDPLLRDVFSIIDQFGMNDPTKV